MTMSGSTSRRDCLIIAMTALTGCSVFATPLWFLGNADADHARMACERERSMYEREKALIADRARWEERAEEMCQRMPLVATDEKVEKIAARWERVIERLARECHVNVGRRLKAQLVEKDLGGVLEMPVEVIYDNTSLQRLVEFLYAVNTAADAMMDVRELDINVKDRKNVGALKGKIVLTCAYLKDDKSEETSARACRDTAVRKNHETCADHSEDHPSLSSEVLKGVSFCDEVVAMTNRVALLERYEDRSKCALEMFRLVAENMPEGEGMTFESFKFKRGYGVEVSGKVMERESRRAFEAALAAARVPRLDDGEEETVEDKDAPLLFTEVKTVDRGQNREGLFSFTIEAKFTVQEEAKPKKGKSK